MRGFRWAADQAVNLTKQPKCDANARIRAAENGLEAFTESSP